jgi:hypothetical protein
MMYNPQDRARPHAQMGWQPVPVGMQRHGE